MNITAMIESRIRRALSALRLPFRARLTALNGAPGLQLAQGQALAGEQLQAVEMVQQFGFTSGVPAGSQLIVLPLAGRTAASVIIATENGSFRVQVGSGETCVYNQWGAKITLKNEKIIEVECDHFIVKAKESIDMQTKTWTAQASEGTTFTSPSLTFGGKDGATASAKLSANMDVQGQIVSTADQVAGGISQTQHTHTGDSGGTTGPPK